MIGEPINVCRTPIPGITPSLLHSSPLSRTIYQRRGLSSAPFLFYQIPTHVEYRKSIYERGDMTVKATQALCFWCKHFDTISLQERDASCAAFPNGIPEHIWYLKYDHREPHEGDNGIRFEKLYDFDKMSPIMRDRFTDEQLEHIFNKYSSLLIELRRLGIAEPPLLQNDTQLGDETG
jgi:hypothetical protein